MQKPALFFDGTSGTALEYRKIRYTIRAGIERGQWFVTIHPEGGEVSARKIFGARQDAEAYARRMIDRLLNPKSRRREQTRG